MQDIRALGDQEYLDLSDAVKNITEFVASPDAEEMDIAKKNMLLSLLNYLNYDLEHPETS